MLQEGWACCYKLLPDGGRQVIDVRLPGDFIGLRSVLLRGAQGSGGELGHVTVRALGPRCSCGNRGCLEALASGTTTGRRAREAAVENPGSVLGRSAARRKVLGD